MDRHNHLTLMERTLKILCTDIDQEKLEAVHNVIARYAGFILIINRMDTSYKFLNSGI